MPRKKQDQPELEEKTDSSLKPAQAHYDIPQDASDADVLDQVLNIPQDEVLPWEEVTLPSKGLYYDGKIPDGKVRVRPMGLYVEKILANQRLAASGQSLDHTFRKCVDFGCEFDPLDLLVGDRMFLLYYLRGITYGPEYEFTFTCANDNCQKSNINAYNLAAIMNTAKYGDESLGAEPFKVTLPYMSASTNRDFWIKVRFTRGKDLQDMLAKQQRRPKGKSDLEFADDTIADNISSVITEAMGKTERHKINALVERLHSEDTATIRSFLEESQPGIDLSIQVECQHCGHTMSTVLPLSEEFFRPKRRKNLRS